MLEQPAPLILGAFELIEPLRRGGMAEVWSGVHSAERAPVAIKLMTAERARTRHLREALQNEVRAMARLDHPGVVRVHDYGEVPEAVARASNGRLAPASPYLVMELADGGTLAPRHVTSWEELGHVLGSVLDALAHAHARGVVHRDIKPSNVLVAGDVFKLSDFGIAHALSHRAMADPSVPLSAGTAWFMAPEQILGLHRDEGPWTDLYAIGCLAHLLATGRLPFPGADRELVYRAHCLSTPPRLAPRFPVPAELEAWISVLLAKRARDRFRLAADAASALRRLGGAWMSAVDPVAAPEEPAVTWSASDTSAATIGASVSPVGGDGPTEDAPLRPESVPPIASESFAMRFETERIRRNVAIDDALAASDAPQQRCAALTGIGLGVYGLKVIPLTGRERACRQLWDQLADAWHTGMPCVVEIRGRAGLGKTRLAEWLVERASEVGAAISLWAGLGPTPSLAEGLPRMIARHLRVEGLPRIEIEERLQHHPTEPTLDELDETERARLVDLLAPTTSRAVTRPEERFAVAERAFAAMGAERPLVLVFDDAHLGREPIAFAEHVLRLRGVRLPVTIVLTVQEDALADRPDVAAALDALSEHPRAHRLALAPLDHASHARLIGSMLGLEEKLARDIAARTSGNPLFAIQLVGDWVQRGDLVVSSEGFALREGASLDLPDDIHGLWSRMLARFLAELPGGTRADAAKALELAALLGRRVNLVEWSAACALAGIEAPDGMLDALATRRLAHVGRTRFSFVHGMLAESLSRRAREEGRIAELHRACARALGDVAATRGRAERIGRHLVAAGDAIEAAPLLIDAARERLAICDFDEVRRLMVLRDGALAAAGVGPRDPERARGYVMRAEADVAQARLEECARAIERAAEVEPKDERVLADLAQLRGRVALKRAENEAAAMFYGEALARMRALGERYGLAHSLHGLAECEKLLGQLDASLRHHEESVAVFEELGDTLDAARVRMGMADVVRRRGELDRAVAIVESALAVTRRLSNAHAVAVALNTLGDIARSRGDVAGAEALYREAIGELEALASEEVPIVALNLALTQLERARFAAARETSERARRGLELEGRSGYVVFAIAALRVCDAGEGEWTAFDERGRELASLIARAPVVDGDLAWLLERAGRLAADAGENARARDALSLALAEWRALEREAEVGAVERAIAALE